MKTHSLAGICVCFLAASTSSAAHCSEQPPNGDPASPLSGTATERSPNANSPQWDAERDIEWDIELDPTPFVLGGFSVHAGLRLASWRFDIGGFSATVPEFFHGNQGFEVQKSGFSFKLDRRFTPTGNGLLIGLDMGVARQWTMHRASTLAQQHRLFDIGARIGYEVSLSQHIYVVPWLAVSYVLDSEDLFFPEASFQAEGPVGYLPAIHLGYRH